MRRIGHSALVIGAAFICGAVALVLSSWIALFVEPRALLSSCSVSAHGASGVCTPLSPWAWFLAAIILAGAAAGGLGMAFLIKRRKSSLSAVVPPFAPNPN